MIAMKVKVCEYDQAFEIDLMAETMEDCVMLIRMGINRTKEVIYAETFAGENCPIVSTISFRCRKQKACKMPHAR